ncbi:hypothetical protein QYE76_045402 [Lolium multiflorum]|uniref:Arabidopsis retrotransposon Orf1 C-terminal domain-containing protein n=1 Tax=Lolium multiflorum TaxID=4521 RepID=A0AAD8TMW3_LOLMU|nr:hypothetical protein QYE76_045402 [Lolium multiflorum]
MGKPRDTKIAILPSTTRKGTTLSTSAALDSPSVISKLVSPPQASNAGTSAESENSSHNCDDASAVLDNDGSLGSFLDATIARSRQIENTETPNENAATPVNSPESVEYSSDDLDEDYVELDDDFIEKCNATTDARKIKKLLAEHVVRYKLSPDPKFATSPINIKDKDYDFSLDLSHIAIVEKTPFCGTEKESVVEHMIEKRTPDDAEELLAKIGRNHDDWSTPEPTPTPIVKKRGMIKLNDEDMREAKKSLKEKGIKPEDVKNLPPIEDLCKITPPSSMIEDPLYPEGHPKRVEQDSQLTKTSAPSKKKKKKHKNVVESSEPVNDPNSISISDAETESGNEHDKDNDKDDTPDKEEVEEEPEKHAKNKKYTKEDFIAEKHAAGGTFMSITLGAATKLLDDMMINYSEWHTERAPQGKKVNSVEETSSLSDKIDVIMSMLVNGRSNVDPNNVPLASLVAQEENVDVNFIKNNNFNNNAYRNNSGNNYRPYPSANGNGYGNSYGNSYNNNRSVPSGLEAMLKEFISTQTAFNKSVEEKLDKIDTIASRVDRLASDVNLLKLKVMPNNDIDNKITTTANAIQVRINENIRLMAELRARWDREENEKLAKENNVAKVWTITTTSNANSSHVVAPPTINGKIIGVGNVSTPSAKRTKLPEIAKTAEIACDKTAEIFSNLGNNDPIVVAHNDLDFDDCHISEVIKFLQKLAKSPNASAINLAFTKHITNALIKAREEKLKLETSIPRKLEDGWEPIIKMKFNDFECNALCDLGASISVMPKKIYDMLDLPPLKNCYLDVNLADNVKKKPLGRIDNVHITVNNNLVPVDFVVLDIECNASCPIVLGRPFLRTVGVVIDMREGSTLAQNRCCAASHFATINLQRASWLLLKRKMKKFNFGELFKRGTTSTGRPSRASTQIRRSYNEDIIAPSFAPEEDNGAPNASSFPCYDFLTNAGILDDFFTLVNRAGLATYVGDEREQYYMLTKIFVESFKFHNTQYEPTVAFKIYGNPVTMKLEEFCRALDIAPVGTARRIDDNPRDLLELYRGITEDDCRTIQRGKIRNIQLPAIKYFAYYIATSILGRENTSNISSYHLAFLNAALTGQTLYHLGSLIARRLSSRGPIFGGTIALRILTHLRLPLDSNDVPLTPRRLDIAAMKSHHFVTTDSTVDNMVYRMLFADGDEKEIPLPQPGLFNIDRQSWSLTKEEVEEHMKIQDFHQQHDSEDAEPSYDCTVTYPDVSSSTYLEPGRSSSYYGDTTSWGPWE